MLIGYVRVSKSDGTQTLAPQRDAMLAAGVDPTRIYEDLASGRRDDRPGLVACLKAIQPGNTLVLWRLDRLGRDLRHLVNTVEDLRARSVGLKVLAGAGAQIDTTTANGRLAFGIFAAFAEFERELIAERTNAGLAAARAVTIDSKQLGLAQAVTTLNSSGGSQAFNFNDLLPSGTHDLAVSFTNDFYAGTPQTDRNLYLKSANYNGHPLLGAEVAMYSNETQHFSLMV